MPKKKSKKHIYSNSKKEGLTIEVGYQYDDLHNPMLQLQALYHLPPSDLISYTSKVMYDREVVDREDMWEDLDAIISETNNIGTRNAIIKQTLKDEYYNPFEDVFPLFLFNDKMKNYIKKKQDFIKKYYYFTFPIKYRDFNILIIYNNQRRNLAELHKLADIVILFNSYSTIISIAKETKEFFDLSKILEKFNNIEPNKWQTNKSKTMLYLKEEKTSKIRLYNNEKLLKNTIDELIIKDANECIEERNKRLAEQYAPNL